MSNIPEYSVTELATSIKGKLEQEYARIRVRGEISGLKKWNGHLLFNLKDNESLLAARIWQYRTSSISINPEEGLEIIALGKISTHMQRSNYNFIIENIELAGEGALLKLIEDRKNKFRLLGFFKEEIKKKLPNLPNKIGIITSPTGAVIEDIKRRIKERLPSFLLLWPVSVQGIKAEQEINRAIKGFNNMRDKPDVIILARGGGSVEDLMPFNSEVVVNSIYKSEVPIISAIGHETDYTLADLVSDFRASTPTAAADIVVPEMKQLKIRLKNNKGYLESFLNNVVEKKESLLKSMSSKINEPSILLKILEKSYLDLFLNIKNGLDHLFKLNIGFVSKLILRKPVNNLKVSKDKYKTQLKLLRQSIKKILDRKEDLIKNEIKVLESYSYERLIEKGFAIIRNSKNEIIKGVDDIKLKDNIKIILKDGETIASIKEINEKNYKH